MVVLVAMRTDEVLWRAFLCTGIDEDISAVAELELSLASPVPMQQQQELSLAAPVPMQQKPVTQRLRRRRRQAFLVPLLPLLA